MQKEGINAHGIKWGIIIGLVYCVLLLLRYNLGISNPIKFSLLTFMGYIIVLVMLLVSGFQLRKQMGGFLELKDAFKAMFVSVLIFEFIYAVFNFIYLKYVNPNFFYQLRDATETLLENSKQSPATIKKTLDSIDVDAPSKMTIFDLLKSYLFYVAITGIFAFIFALIVKRKRDIFEDQDHLLQPQQ